MQNKLWLKRVHINKELSYLIAKPLRLHNQAMQLSERIDLLLGMEELANRAYYMAYDNNTAIHIVNSQSEYEIAAPFSTEQSRLDLSRLLSEMNREIEHGNNINLTNLYTRLGNVFPPEQELPADVALHQALLASTMCTAQRDTQRRSEQKDQPTEIESNLNKAGKSKRKYDCEQEEPEPWIGCSHEL